ncbi:hypothetical protein ES703_68423 [subsurface metagenome]
MAEGFMEKRVDPKYIANMASAQANIGAALWILGFIFAILGIVADTMNGSLGLTAMSWFLLAIVFHLAGLSYWLGWAVAVYFRGKGAKKEG